MVPEITRRQALATGAIGAFVPFAGCSTIGRFDGSDVELGQLTVENSDEVAHTIHVLVERNAEPIYGRSVELEPVSSPESADDFGSIDSEVLDHPVWSDQSGAWTIFTRIDENTSWHPHPVPTNTDTDCYSVRLKIERDSSVTSFLPDCDSWPPASTRQIRIR